MTMSPAVVLDSLSLQSSEVEQMGCKVSHATFWPCARGRLGRKVKLSGTFHRPLFGQ